jgi:hypothetical protein
MNLARFTHFTEFTRFRSICFWIGKPSKTSFLVREYKIE